MLCEKILSSPEGALSNPAPVHLTTLDSALPIPTNGETSSTPEPRNASLPLCPVCNAPLTPPKKKFCSKKCGTLSRVRRLRAKTAPLRELKTSVENDYLSRRRSAVTDCTAGTSLLRDVGKDTDYERAKEIERQCKDANKTLRAASTKKRRELKRQRKDAWRVVLALSSQIKGITPALVLAIAESEAVIKADAVNQTPTGQKRGTMFDVNSKEMKAHRASMGSEYEHIAEIRDNAQEIAVREAGHIARRQAVLSALDLFVGAASRYIRMALPAPRSCYQNAADRSDAYSECAYFVEQALHFINHDRDPFDAIPLPDAEIVAHERATRTDYEGEIR